MGSVALWPGALTSLAGGARRRSARSVGGGGAGGARRRRRRGPDDARRAGGGLPSGGASREGLSRPSPPPETRAEPARSRTTMCCRANVVLLKRWSRSSRGGHPDPRRPRRGEEEVRRQGPETSCRCLQTPKRGAPTPNSAGSGRHPAFSVLYFSFLLVVWGGLVVGCAAPGASAPSPNHSKPRPERPRVAGALARS